MKVVKYKSKTLFRVSSMTQPASSYVWVIMLAESLFSKINSKAKMISRLRKGDKMNVTTILHKYIKILN